MPQLFEAVGLMTVAAAAVSFSEKLVTLKSLLWHSRAFLLWSFVFVFDILEI